MIATVSPKIAQHASANLSALAVSLRSEWEPIEAPPICDWIEANLRFGPGDGDAQIESRTGPFTFEDSPWWRFPMECAASTSCYSFVMPAATQTHKTANLLFAVPLYFAEFRPAPGMIIVPDELEAKKVRDRLYTVVEESRKFTTFERISIPPQHKRNLQEIDLGSMLIHLAWAGSRQRTRGKPCHYVWMTEIDVYRDSIKKAGDPVEAGKQRTKDVFRYKHFFESSPCEKPSTISDEESMCDDRWRWFIECPHCGLKQETRFFLHRKGDFAGRGGIELTVRAIGTDGDSLMSPQQARKASYYVCLNGCKIDSDHRQTLMESGNWYPIGWKPKDAEPDRTPSRSVGFHLWAAHSPTETWGTIAEDYLRNQIKGLVAEFWGNRLAIPYEGSSKIPSWVDLGRRAAWTNARRTVPDGCWFLTAGIDKQGENNGTRYVVRGWGPGRTSWLIDWGWIARDESDTGPILSDLIDLEREVLVSQFQVLSRKNEPSINPLGKSKLGVRLACIDTNHLPMQIHRWMRQLPETWVDRMQGKRLLPGRVRNIRGDSAVRPDVRFKHALVENNTRTGEKYDGGLHLWGICVYPFYSELTGCITGEPGQLGSWYVTSDCLAKGREYLEQVTNFHLAIEWDHRKGKIRKWRPRSGRIPVDFWDCEIYAMAAAEMVVGSMGWEEAAWLEWRESTMQKAGTTKQANTARRRSSQPEEIGAR